MRIDKASTEYARVELSRRERVELLPLLDSSDASLVVESDNGVWHDVAIVDHIVCGDTAHIIGVPPPRWRG